MSAFEGLLVENGGWRGRSFRDLSVAVIAPGHEAALIVPEVLQTARAVKVFQEEPDWLLPSSRLLSLPPVLGRVVARLSLRRAVDDPWTRRRLTPSGKFNRRRPQVDTRYYASLQQPNCTLISWPVYAVVAQGIRSAEGIEHHVDCIVLGETSVLTEHINREESCA